MNRLILTTIALYLAAIGAYAQRCYTFNAVALNVDGLPESISGVTINEGAPGAAGATIMGNAIAKENWGIVGLSEDFDYHESLVAPLSNYYHEGSWRGKIDIGLADVLAQKSADTDGLGLLVTESDGTGYSDEKWVQWNTYNGYTDQGADGLIKKGFRYYAVAIASGIVVDVYILHMDADSGEKDIAARNAQLTQLATYIKENKHGRPILIIGDTNCRYTRDALKANLIDAINADSRLTIKDAWIELMWGGAYPELGTDAMMWYNAPYNNNTGEVVDKIFYINDSQSSLTIKANSYNHNTSFGVSDHYPVVVNFTLTDPNGTAVDNSSWQVNGGTIIEDDNMLDGCQVTDGTTYYIKNVSTGLYLNSGATWGTQACEGSAGMPITVTLSNGKYRLGTLNGSMSAVDTPFMDNQDNTTWTLQEVENTQYQYYLKINDTKALSSTGEKANPNSSEDYIVNCQTFNANDDKQKWILLTEERMKEEMANASASEPFDITPLLKAAGFDCMDVENDYASTNWSGLSFSYWQNDVTSGHNGSAQYVGTGALNVSQTISSLPAGTYTISFEGFYRAQAKKYSFSSSLSDYTMTVTISFGSGSVNLKQNTGLDIGGDARWHFLDNDSWLTSFDVTTTAQGDMTLKIAKPTFSSGNKNQNSWIAIDNFVIKYKGDGSEEENVLSVKTKVGNHINITAQKVAQLNASGQAAYDITNVLYRYNNDLISSDGQAEIAMIDAAYETALIAHNRGLIDEALGNGDGNVTSLITNPSFETGDLTGWTIDGNGTDVNVYPNSNGTYTTNGCDGSYLFNSYGGDDAHTAYLKQTIKGIPNGLYELKAMLASYGTADSKTHNYHIYLTGNDYHTSVAAVGGKTVGQEATLYFLVEDGTATIGAVGGNKGGGSEFIHYWPWEGCFFKADNFRLRYICDAPHGRLKLALMDAEDTTLDDYGKATLDISSYQTAYDNKSLTSDGKTEAAAVRSALQTATKAQKTVDADMTWAITNPSFETGDYTGWTVTAIGDTGAKPQENGTYTIAGTDGRYMFNIWDAGIGNPISQTVTGIPNGKYKVSAMVASDNGNSLILTANGTSVTIAASTNGASSGVFPEVECTVSNHELVISVEGVNSCWYKCDDFRLTYLGNELTLSETDTETAIADDWYTSVNLTRTIGTDKWNTFVVPFDMAIPTGWEVKALTSSTQNGDNITLVFDDATTIEAGKSYMVRVNEAVSSINVENTQVIAELKNPTTDHVEFAGVYSKGNVPAGSFFISNNKFYHAADGTNTIKGYRAYIAPTSSNARTINFGWGDGETTDLDTVAEEATIEGIYTIGGVRINSMQQGINVLRMSDGRIVKVIIK